MVAQCLWNYSCYRSCCISASAYFLTKSLPESAIHIRDLPALLRTPKARSGMLIVLLIGLAHFCAYSYLAPFFKKCSRV